MTRTRRAARPPVLLHPGLIGAGAALLIGALATDILYWRTLLPGWETFSVWLLTGGLILAALSGLGLVRDSRLGRVPGISPGRFLGLGVAALLSLLNALIHSRDGYTAVVPQGLGLSAIVAVLLLAVGRRGWSLCAARPSPSVPSQGVPS
jgi:uncharacterized membrane protein